MELDNNLEKERVLDVSSIISRGLESMFFPGLIKNIKEIRKRDFPLLDSLNRVYLDSTATSQEPQSVKDRMYEYRKTHIRGSNHSKHSAEAREAQEQFELAREKVRNFFNANNYFVAFTSGTTASSNLLATRFPFEERDLLLLTKAEHHSQILTHRNFANIFGSKVNYIPICLPDGELDLDYLKKVVSEHKKGKILLNLIHVSNISGIINPVERIKEITGDRCLIYLDMAQSAGHLPINLDSLDIDFAGISSHKMYGPMGMGAIFVNKRSDKFITNRVSGGGAVELVSRNHCKYSDSPVRLELGTPDIEGAIEFGYAIDYLNKIGMHNIESHDKELGRYFLNELKKIDNVRIYGPKEFKNRTAVITFNIGDKKNYDETAIRLDEKETSVRDGCFCGHLYMPQLLGFPEWLHDSRTKSRELGFKDFAKLPGAVRASFAFYNTLEDAYRGISAIREIAQEKDNYNVNRIFGFLDNIKERMRIFNQ